MRTIESLAEIKELIKGKTHYVRWQVIDEPVMPTRSKDWAAGTLHDGVSASQLTDESGELVLSRVTEYMGICGTNGWIITGQRAWNGWFDVVDSDGCPLLEGDTIRIVAKIGAGLIAEIQAIRDNDLRAQLTSRWGHNAERLAAELAFFGLAA